MRSSVENAFVLGGELRFSTRRSTNEARFQFRHGLAALYAMNAPSGDRSRRRVGPSSFPDVRGDSRFGESVAEWHAIKKPCKSRQLRARGSEPQRTGVDGNRTHQQPRKRPLNGFEGRGTHQASGHSPGASRLYHGQVANQPTCASARRSSAPFGLCVAAVHAIWAAGLTIRSRIIVQRPSAPVRIDSCQFDDTGERLSRKPSSFRARTGCCSLRMALASTCRTRSRVTLKILPTSSSVYVYPSPMP